MGIVGFAVGALIAIVIRLLQGIDPNPAAPYGYVGPAMVLGVFISAGFFVWGMGAFDPAMSVHGEHAEEPHEEPAVEREAPAGTLMGYIWRITSVILVGFLIVFAIAALPHGPAIRTVPGNGNPAAVSYTTLQDVLPWLPASFNGSSIQISSFALFLIFFAITVFSLLVVAGLLAITFTYLARAKADPENTPVPWRPILFVLLVLGPMITFLVLFPTMQLPSALIMPLYLIPPILFLAAYRRPIFGLWLVLALLVPVLAAKSLGPADVLGSAIPVPPLQTVLMFIILGALVVIAARAVEAIFPAGLWERLRYLVYFIALVLIVPVPIIIAARDMNSPNIVIFLLAFIFVVTLTLISAGLLLPVWFLKLVIPASIWNRFAAVNWVTLVPDFFGWLANLLRGLPLFLGER
jgi:hypothetical protein